MSEHHEKSDYLLDRFETWLKDTRVTPDKGFLEGVRARMNETPMDLDDAIDSLLRPNPDLRDPHMAAKIRQRMEQTIPARPNTPWFQWLTPLAAAAMLGLAFVSFQMQAPDTRAPVATFETPTPLLPTFAEPDSDLTQIFALAANLHGPADVSSLQSVDNLAYLFE
jgi:hypothetical protein